jgi:hypothetical protein
MPAIGLVGTSTKLEDVADGWLLLWFVKVPPLGKKALGAKASVATSDGKKGAIATAKTT